MRNLLNILGVSLLMATAFVSCNKSENPPVINDKTMDNLIVADNFDWSTAKPSTFKVRTLDNINQPIQGAKIAIYTNDPDLEDGKLIVSGQTDGNGYFIIDHDVPAYYEEVFVTTDYVGLPTPGMVSLNNNGFDIVLGGKVVRSSLKSVMATFKYKRKF